MMCETSGCRKEAKRARLCAECLKKRFPLLEEMTVKALFLVAADRQAAMSAL